MPINSQIGIKAESTYATPVTVDQFTEFASESIEPQVGRARMRTFRASQRVRRGDRVIPYVAGYAGSVTMPVMAKGHGIYLKMALGGMATSGPTDSAYTHTGTIADLTGDMFTLQVDKPFNPSGTSQPITYAGGKITSAEWSLTTGESGLLSATYGMDFASAATGTGLASASYPASNQVYPWINAGLTIGGAAVEVVEARISLTNALQLDRRFIRSSSTKKEPLENGERTITFSITCDFVDLTQYNRVVSTTVAGMQSAVVLTCTALTLIGTTTYPTVTFTLPQAEFDAVSGVAVSGDDPIRQTLTGEATYDGTNSPLTIAYVSADATV